MSIAPIEIADNPSLDEIRAALREIAETLNAVTQMVANEVDASAASSFELSP